MASIEKQITDLEGQIKTKGGELRTAQSELRTYEASYGAWMTAFEKCSSGKSGDSCRQNNGSKAMDMEKKVEKYISKVDSLETEVQTLVSQKELLENPIEEGHIEQEDPNVSLMNENGGKENFVSPYEVASSPNGSTLKSGGMDNFTTVMGGINGFVNGVGDVMEGGFSLNHKVDTSNDNKIIGIVASVLAGVVVLFLVLKKKK